MPETRSKGPGEKPTAAVLAPRGGDQELERLRVDIAGTIRRTFPWLFLLTVGVALALVVMVWLGFLWDKAMDATVLAASVQVAFGMVIGFFCVYLGLMMTWFGLDAAYTLHGSLDTGAGKAEGALKSASPGLLFALAGIVLIAVSLHKKIEYQEGGFRSHGSIDADTDATQPGVPPMRVLDPREDR